MDGPHDLGGRMDFGLVVVEPGEPVFHEPWEAVAFTLVYAVSATVPHEGLSWFRYAIERMDPAHYLGSPYYEHWLTAAATLAVEGGLVTAEDLDERAGGRFPLSRPIRAEPVDTAGTGGERFSVGDRVRVVDRHPVGHTRCPGYVRGHAGTVVRAHGRHPLPDLEGRVTPKVTESVYAVGFDAAELWHDGQTGVRVHADLWDSYLEPA